MATVETSGRKSKVNLEDAAAHEGPGGDKNHVSKETDGAATEVRLKGDSFIAMKITLGSGHSFERYRGRQNQQSSHHDHQRAPESVTRRWRNPP